MRRRLVVAALLVVVTACSPDTPPADTGASAQPGAVLTTGPVPCDVDRAGDEAKDTVERVGGLRTPDWTVRFALSTRVGVVALVEGDVDAAYAELTGTYRVAVVAPIGETDATSSHTAFGQVDDIVARLCP